MAEQFNKLPATALTKPRPFTVSIPDEQIQEFHQHLKLGKIGSVTYEAAQEDRKYGITADWLQHAKDQWLKFDWRDTEKEINSFPNYRMEIEQGGTKHNIHFVALFSEAADAVPILMLHGWPCSSLEYFPILRLLRAKYTPSTLPYHIIVPSFPGFGFSSPPPKDRDFRLEDASEIFDTLMQQLGFSGGYVVQGSDIGSMTARILSGTSPSVKAMHLNFCVMANPGNIPESAYTALEKAGLQRLKQYYTVESAYASEHATKPSTIGLVVASSPIALLAWVGEKFLDWTDEDPPLKLILEHLTLYWLTECFATSLWPYRQFWAPPISPHDNTAWHTRKPMGMSWFPKEVLGVPRAWVETTGNLVFWREHERGGHFPALERPEVLLGDLESFVEQVWIKQS